MKKINMTNVTRAINKAGFKLKKHSPEILVVAGVVGAVASAIMACKATMKLSDTLNDTKERVEDFHADETNYTEEEGKKTLTLIYSKAALDIAKLYGPSVVLGGLSITAILTSNNILRKRNIALAAAYTALDNIVEDYEEHIGDDALGHFGEYEDDSVFVRNDEEQTDYEILLDGRNYHDVYGDTDD